jgi:2-polyprenyl-3-methyl-5-hydroxy-6-metoxy-1,4-benzoquinol methylase
MERKTATDWTPENVRRLWTYWNSKAHLQGENFSYQVGAGIVNFLQSTGRLQGKALDYGCGLGYVLQNLLDRGLECSAAEFSAESVDLVNRKFHTYPHWKGATLVSGLPTKFQSAAFDVIICTEAVEHLSDDLLPQVISEMYRLLKPGGTILFTTPNEEDLEQAMTYCPFCEAEFHKVQHLRSFSQASLKNLLESHGFQLLFCQNINFAEFQRTVTLSPYKELSLNRLREWLATKKDVYLDRISPRSFPEGRDFNRRSGPGPHLCAVATRPNQVETVRS